MKVDKNLFAKNSSWTFDKNVPKEFDKHIYKSVPLYHQIQWLCEELSDFYLKDDSLVYDIGCSTGSLLKKIPKTIHNETSFTHPKFNLQTMKSQNKLKDLQGVNNTFFCGAYHGYGFHEDGIQSAAYISKLLNVDIPWKRDNNFYNRLLY